MLIGDRGSWPRLGFTLVELIVVLGIVVLLMGLALPAIFSLRSAGQNTTCKNNLRQLAIGANNQAFHTGGKSRLPTIMWDNGLLDFVEQSNRKRSIEINPSGLHAQDRPALLTCPASPLRMSSHGKTEPAHYALVREGVICDIPVSMHVSWASWPELSHIPVTGDGPHNGWYNVVNILDGSVRELAFSPTSPVSTPQFPVVRSADLFQASILETSVDSFRARKP